MKIVLLHVISAKRSFIKDCQRPTVERMSTLWVKRGIN